MVNGFQTEEMSGIADRLKRAAAQIQAGVMEQVRRMVSTPMIRSGLLSYEALMYTLMANKPVCVTGDIRSSSANAVAPFNDCLPSEAMITAETEKCQKALDAVIDQLRAVDLALLAIQDPVLRAAKVADADLKIVGAFYLQATYKIFDSVANIQRCVADAGTKLRDTALNNVAAMADCYVKH